jgi:hypothetical protein
MIKNPMLIEQRSHSARNGSAPQAGKIGVIRVEPNRDFPVAITEDHRSFVTEAAAAYPGASAEQLGTASGGPIHGCGICCRRRVPRIGIHMIQPPGNQAATGMLHSGGE